MLWAPADRCQGQGHQEVSSHQILCDEHRCANNIDQPCSIMLRYDTIGKIELIPSIVLSSDNTNYKNDIQLFHQLFDELSVYRDYH